MEEEPQVGQEAGCDDSHEAHDGEVPSGCLGHSCRRSGVRLGGINRHDAARSCCDAAIGDCGGAYRLLPRSNFRVGLNVLAQQALDLIHGPVRLAGDGTGAASVVDPVRDGLGSGAVLRRTEEQLGHLAMGVSYRGQLGIGKVAGKTCHAASVDSGEVNADEDMAVLSQNHVPLGKQHAGTTSRCQDVGPPVTHVKMRA